MKCRAVVAAALAFLAGCQEEDGAQKEAIPGNGKKTLTVTSSAFRNGEGIPKKYAYKGEGENVSPPLSWSGAPEGTKEFVLICDDPDAPRAEAWVHWVLYKIPVTTTSLAEGDNGGAIEGRNDFKEMGWGGPMPPKGHGVHHYHFRVYALGTGLFGDDVKGGATKQQIETAMKGHILAWGELVGTYER